MKQWFTCIITIEHYEPSYLHTRAENPGEAQANAMRWVLDREPDRTAEEVDVPFVFGGKLESVN